MPLNSISEIKEDILVLISWIKSIGYIPKLFAYPYGEASNEVIDILKEFDISLLHLINTLGHFQFR